MTFITKNFDRDILKRMTLNRMTVRRITLRKMTNVKIVFNDTNQYATWQRNTEHNGTEPNDT